MQITKLYLDMDGVLADFDRGLLDCGIGPTHLLYHHRPRETWTAEEEARDVLVRGVMNLEDFWPAIPPMADAYELWDYCKQFNVHILTATPNLTPHRDRIADQKRQWIQRTFGPFPVEQIHICLRSEKAAFAGPTHLLVDDIPVNCKEWNAAGGNAILHSTAKNTIKHLTELYHG